MQAAYINGGLVRLTIAAGEKLTVVQPTKADPGLVLGEGSYDVSPAPGLLIWEAMRAAGIVVAAPPVDLAAYTTAAHAALRDGGVDIGGMRIKTDGESRGLIDGAYALSQTRPDTAIDFKAASGWVTIDPATMQTVAVAVGLWVQACYSAYRQVDARVADGTYTTTAQIDAAFAAVTLPG
ncbi:DUF4376 domain-containing protein [Methylobacterium sp. D54C]